jgi:hypothetical protein
LLNIRGRLELELLAAGEAEALRPLAAVDAHAGVHRALGRGARADVLGEEAVEAHARRLRRDA